jgi:hypothetical protein
MRAGHETAGEASNHPSGQLNHLGALDADTTDAGPERTLRHRRRTVNADDQFDAAVNDQRRPAKKLTDALAKAPPLTGVPSADARKAAGAAQSAVEQLTIAGLLRVATTTNNQE